MELVAQKDRRGGYGRLRGFRGLWLRVLGMMSWCS